MALKLRRAEDVPSHGDGGYWTINLQMLLEEKSSSINVLSLKGEMTTLQAITGLRRCSDCESHPETESLVECTPS